MAKRVAAQKKPGGTNRVRKKLNPVTSAAKKTAAKSMGVQKGHTQDSEVIARTLPIPAHPAA